jgi:septum formation protein
MDKIWIAPAPLLLASTSVARADMLMRAGLPVKPLAPAIEERLLEKQLTDQGEAPVGIACHLSAAKARGVSVSNPGAYVLGFDQTLEFEKTCLSKPLSREELRIRLTRFSGRQHLLHSGFAIALDGRVLDEGVITAIVQFRCLSDRFIETYLDLGGLSVLNCVGGYQAEALGVHLFEKIEGDFFTVVGMPLLHLLRSLRSLGLVLQ